MKKTILGFIAVMISSALLAQTPQLMSYQAVIRNGSNQLLANAPAGVRVSILQGSASGTAVYSETHTVTTNAQGLANLSIGGGTAQSGTFAGIDWANGPYFLKTETDPTGGTNYSITATSQLMSVPYALYAERSATPGPQGPQGVQGPQGPIGPPSSMTCYSCPTAVSQRGPGNSYSYQDASQYCSNLVEGGYNDWRIPTLAEFEYVRDVLNLPGTTLPCWTKDSPVFQIWTQTISSGIPQIIIWRVLTDGSWMTGNSSGVTCVR